MQDDQGTRPPSGTDVEVGQSWTGKPIHMSRDPIIAFAREFDPQDMHLEENSSGAQAFGGIIASGWHVAALVMRDTVDTTPFGSQQVLGMGVDELRWLKPVKPGDTLVATRTIEDIRTSRSRPDRRIIRMSTVLRNQRQEDVMSFFTTIQLPQSR